MNHAFQHNRFNQRGRPSTLGLTDETVEKRESTIIILGKKKKRSMTTREKDILEGGEKVLKGKISYENISVMMPRGEKKPTSFTSRDELTEEGARTLNLTKGSNTRWDGVTKKRKSMDIFREKGK